MACYQRKHNVLFLMLLISSALFSVNLKAKTTTTLFSKSDLFSLEISKDTFPETNTRKLSKKVIQQDFFRDYADPIYPMTKKRGVISQNKKRGYTIIIGVYDNLNYANQKIDNLRTKVSEPVLLAFAVKDGKQFYRVMVGQFASEMKAKRVNQKLQELGVNGSLAVL